MNSTPLSRSFAVVLLSGSFLISCSSTKTQDQPETQVASPAVVSEAPPPPSINTENIKVSVYMIVDSVSGKSLGWGYDLIFAGGAKIHQPTIPAVQGIQYFSSSEKANKTAEFAAAKIKRCGGLAGITTNELDSLGVTK